MELALEGPEASAEMVDLGVVRLRRILGAPLKRSIGARHERIDAEIEGDVPAETLAKGVEAVHQVDHGIEILFCLGRKAKHEVELDEMPAFPKNSPQRFKDRFLSLI